MRDRPDSPYRSASQIAPVRSFLIDLGLLFGELTADLTAQVEGGDPGNFAEDTGLDVIVEGLLRNVEFRMDGKDLVRGEALSEKGSDERGHGDGFLNGEVHASAGVHQSRTVIQVRIFRGVAELVEAAARPAGTAVAGTGRAVTSGAAERRVFGAVRSALAAMNTFAIMVAFERHLTLMGKGAMEADLFGDGRSIFTDGLGDGRLGRAIGDTGKDDPAFFQGQV